MLTLCQRRLLICQQILICRVTCHLLANKQIAHTLAIATYLLEIISNLSRSFEFQIRIQLVELKPVIKYIQPMYNNVLRQSVLKCINLYWLLNFTRNKEVIFNSTKLVPPKRIRYVSVNDGVF